MNRRNFVTAMTSGLFGLGVSKHLGADSPRLASGLQAAAAPKVKTYKDLGKTGLKVPDVSFGAISLFEPNVLRYAYECGVTYFDTAESYLRMKGETYVGQGLKEVRDKVIITTKHGQNFRQKIEKDAFIQRVEASLKRLQTDHIDVAMIHNVDDLSLALNNQELMSAYAQLKKDGKVRFTGFSTHNAKQTLKQAIDADFAQVVLVMYNHMEGKEIEPLVKAVRQKGIGTVAMKIFAGGMQGNLKSMVNQQTSYSQAAIRWVLSNPDFDTCIPTMSSYSHVEEYVAASGLPLDRAALQTLALYREEVGDVYCRVSCRKCLSACPDNVAINDVLRYGLYYEHYGMERQAVDYYAELESERKPLNCAGCAAPCQSACPYGLQVKSKLLRTHDILSA
ncbi:MAG: aldo/keto reductase [Candidatus Aminicenantes bacterium]|nr:aldo/keto reductase [Candidatus Aminicenantes bacterium]